MLEVKAIQLEEEQEGKIVTVRISGKLTKEDYEQFVPEIERAIQRHGKIRMLVELIDFHGWTAGALWEDTKFDARHFNDIERLAFVGEARWEKGMATFCRAFTTAKIRYFDLENEDDAIRWIHED